MMFSKILIPENGCIHITGFTYLTHDFTNKNELTNHNVFLTTKYVIIMYYVCYYNGNTDFYFLLSEFLKLPNK